MFDDPSHLSWWTLVRFSFTRDSARNFKNQFEVGKSEKKFIFVLEEIIVVRVKLDPINTFAMKTFSIRQSNGSL